MYSGRYAPPTQRQRTLAFLRRLFIGFVVAVFLVYCWAAVVYQNQVNVPAYRVVSVDLLGGKTRQQWDAGENAQFQRLTELENRRYQLPPDAKVGTGREDGSFFPVDRPLTGRDFAAIIAAAPAGEGVVMELRDPEAINSLASLGYHLRDPIYDPGNPDGEPTINFGEAVDKAFIDRLNGLGVKTIAVVGEGAPVGVDVGTVVMIALIFLGLVAALKPILWDPFQALIDRRQKELAMGAEAARNNQAESAKLAEEKTRRNAKLMQEVQAEQMRRRQATANEAGAIVKAAKDQAKAARHSQLQEITTSSQTANQELQADVPQLAEAIAGAILGRGVGASQPKDPEG